MISLLRQRQWGCSRGAAAKTKPSHTCSSWIWPCKKSQKQTIKRHIIKHQLKIFNQSLSIHSSWYQRFWRVVLRQGLQYTTPGISDPSSKAFSFISRSLNKNNDFNPLCNSVLGELKKIFFIRDHSFAERILFSLTLNVCKVFQWLLVSGFHEVSTSFKRKYVSWELSEVEVNTY